LQSSAAPLSAAWLQRSAFSENTMDSVIVFFATASFEHVELEASAFGFVNGTVVQENEQFYMWRYPEQTMRAESEMKELEMLSSAVRGEVKSAFQVACRHGVDARFALRVVSQIMSKFKQSALNDDFGGLWLPDQVAICASSDPQTGIFALRTNA
jgi:hypothetical protein